MSRTTIIAWTDHTWNPWMGCKKVSPGCANCYAERLTRDRMGLRLWGRRPRQVTSVANWRKPERWNRDAQANGMPRKVFCASLCDVFEDHPIANRTRPRVFETIRRCSWLTFQILTKRPERILKGLPNDWGSGWANVWLGTSIENNEWVHRADFLCTIPAVVRFVSYEPALGPLDKLDLNGIDWVIYGGESGPRHRPEDKQWARDMRDRCSARGVAFFHKQSASYRTEMGTLLDGKEVREFPTPRVYKSSARSPANDQR